MDFDNRTVQGHGLDLNAHDLRPLELLEHSIKDAVLGPTIHPGVNGVPTAEPLGQTTPFAALLGNIQDRVQNLQIREAYIASLPRQTVLDTLVLCFGDFHTRMIPQF